MTADYEIIGKGYNDFRKPDKRIRDILWTEIGDARSVINIGAGAGSYEPVDRHLVAVDPSPAMIAQRPEGSAPAILASAENLPFENGEFELSMAVLTLHHWSDLDKGLNEMKRVSHRQLILTWDPSHPGFWLTQDYFREILSIDKAIFPDFARIQKILGPMKQIPIPIPHDCTDGFACAYWRRPEAYLSPEVRLAISTFSKIKSTETGLEKLRQDLETGEWEKRYGNLKKLEALDLGYTLLVN